MILSLSTELHNRLYQALLHCEEFNVNIRLEEELAKYNGRVFDDPYNAKDEKGKKEELAERAIKYLVRQRIKRVQPVLPLFLMVLHDKLGEDDELRYEIEELHTLVVSELDEIVKSQAHTIVKATPAINPMLPPSPSSLPPPLYPMSDVFLDQTDRDKIIQITVEIFDAMGSDHEGKKSLLRYSGLPDFLINTINFNAAQGNLADKVIGYLEKRDKQDVSMTCLENFAFNIVNKIYKGTESETDMKNIIVRYDNKRKLHANKIQNSCYQASLQSKDGEIAKQLQEARNIYSRDPSPVSSYKIDMSMIIQCNLGTQRKSFTTSFNERFKGFFTFAVACTDRTVLENYVLGSLLWELQKNNPRPTKVHHVPFYSQSIDNSTADQGSISVQKQIQQFFHGKSLRDVFEDRRDDNLAVVLWPTNPLPYNFKEIALLFSETVKQQVSDIAQNRCFLLFWAKYGPAPIEPLEISGALPAFERFEVEHIFDWWDVLLSYQLKAQNIPEQDIQQWRKILVERVTYHNGYLPWTYDCLLDPLERGGVF